MKGPQIEGTDSKIRLEYFQNYYSMIMSSLDLSGHKLHSFNLITRKSTPNVLSEAILNYQIKRQHTAQIQSRKILITNRMTNQVEAEMDLCYDISTGFCVVEPWYFILPKIGSFVEFINWKTGVKR